MYKAFFGMTCNPFRKDIPVSQLFSSEDLRNFLARMAYLQQTLGLAVIYGRPGMGKTTALRAFAAQLNSQLFNVIYRPLTSLTVLEFYRGLCQDCGLEPAFKKVDMYKRLQEYIRTLSRKRVVPVFILDEAQFLSQAVLNELRMIFNFHMDSKDYAVLVLCGQNRFIGQLNLHGNEALRQRLSVGMHDKRPKCGCFVAIRIADTVILRPLETQVLIEAYRKIMRVERPTRVPPQACHLEDTRALQHPPKGGLS